MRIIRVVTSCIKSSFAIAYDVQAMMHPPCTCLIKFFKSTSSGNASIQPTKRDDPSGVGGIGHKSSFDCRGPFLVNLFQTVFKLLLDHFITLDETQPRYREPSC